MRISSQSVRTQGTQKSNAMAIHYDSFVRVSGWAHCSYGQAHTLLVIKGQLWSRLRSRAVNGQGLT
jgi:hypothetical protein